MKITILMALLLAGFQAQATPVYSSVYARYPIDLLTLTTDERIYTSTILCIANWLCDYEDTLAATAEGGAFQGHRIADLVDVNFYTSQIFEGYDPSCDTTVDGLITDITTCRDIWVNGEPTKSTMFMSQFRYLTGDSSRPVGLIMASSYGRLISDVYYLPEPAQSFTTVESDEWFMITNRINRPIPWLLVKDVDVKRVPESPSIALFVMGLVGLGFTRRRRQNEA